jgi:diacylglycerol O-acyltransferase/trehalose O-mycolyltransferase
LPVELMSRRTKVRGLVALCAVVGLIGVAPSVASAWPTCIERTDTPIPGVSLAARQNAGRVVTLTLNSRAMADQQTVNVLLPQNYDPSGRHHYPVLYLLHGAGGDNRLYLDQYPLESLVGGMPLIVVMPDGSGPDASGQKRNGGYSDWFGVEAGRPGPAFSWETYHLRELVPFIDRTFRTIPRAAGRAIAGISMGGGGAMKYAAAYPGTFGYAGSFSGEIDPDLPEAQAFQTPNCKLGDPSTEEVVWRDNDATNLAANLRGVRLFVRSGNGTPGPFDSPTEPADPGEAAAWQIRLLTEYGAGLMAQGFLAATGQLGIPVDADIYPGSHSKPYWEREMPEFFSWLGAQLAHRVKDRRSFSVESARRWFTAWGWTLQVNRRVREFLYVHAAKGRRLRLTGSGRVLLTSAEIFEPRQQYAVRIGHKTLTRRADRQGRLRFRVSLGPSHTKQQTSFALDATRGWKSVGVRIARAD